MLPVILAPREAEAGGSISSKSGGIVRHCFSRREEEGWEKEKEKEVRKRRRRNRRMRRKRKWRRKKRKRGKWRRKRKRRK